MKESKYHKERKAFLSRNERIEADRRPMIELWADVADFQLAYRGKYLYSIASTGGEKNRPKRNRNQLNNKARRALRTAAAGMMTGITSPARPWFRLGMADPEMARNGAIKEWLHHTQSLMYRIFASSNFYDTVHQLYIELLVFATANMAAFHNYDSVARFRTYPIGSYSLDSNGCGKIDTSYFRYSQNVGQVVKEFGLENCSNKVQKLWKDGKENAMVELLHAIEPNDGRDSLSPFAHDMPFRSVVLEVNCDERDYNKFLRTSGFRSFPCMTPRWDIVGDEVYGTDCPGIMCLGDTKGLQVGEKRKGQVIDKITDPPLFGTKTAITALGGKKTPGPGEVIETSDANAKLTGVYGNYAPNIAELNNHIDRIEQRISETYYENLFLLISQQEKGMTATEVAERHEEKLLVLGPVLERVHSELLDPLIERVFELMVASGIAPPPPRGLNVKELNVEYVSILAQAQKLVAVTGLERLTAFTANLGAVWPAAVAKIDPMVAVDEYADSWGINPKIVRTTDEAAQIVEAQVKQAAQQNALDQQQQQAATAKDTASASTMAAPGDSASMAALQGVGVM